MTSSGHVTMPEAIPAEAPQKALTVELGSRAHCRARLERGEPKFWGCSREESREGATIGGAYRSLVELVELGDGGGSEASVDIVEAIHCGLIRH